MHITRNRFSGQPLHGTAKGGKGAVPVAAPKVPAAGKNPNTGDRDERIWQPSRMRPRLSRQGWPTDAFGVMGAQSLALTVKTHQGPPHGV